MQHSFDVDIAKKYGVNEAIILNNLWFWIKHNEANGTNFYDGKYWTYNSNKAFQALFPYLSKRRIETALNKLKEEGLIETGNYNEFAYDRTLWYSFTNYGKCILLKCEMDSPEMGNGFSRNVKPIPDNKPDNKPDIKGKTKFSPPTQEEVKNYCKSRNNNVDVERFIDFYQSKGWYVGKNKMKDWKAAVRNWERSSNKEVSNVSRELH